MDILLSSFVNKYIDPLTKLFDRIGKILNFEDEIILAYYNKGISQKKLIKIYLKNI